MTSCWRKFTLQPQSKGNLSREKNGMACGLACMEMIQMWATQTKDPAKRSVWLKETGATDLQNDGVTMTQLKDAARKLLPDCRWLPIGKNDLWEIPHAVTSKYRDDYALVLGQMECLWPKSDNELALYDCGHFLVLRQFSKTRKHGWIVSVADPLRYDCLAYERWPRVLERLHAAAIIEYVP